MKTFLHEHIVPGRYGPKVTVEWVGGAAPTAFFRNDANEVVEQVSLEPLNRQQIGELLSSRGFAPIDKDEL